MEGMEEITLEEAIGAFGDEPSGEPQAEPMSEEEARQLVESDD